MTLPQAAMAFPLQHPVVAGIVAGMRSAGEVRRNAELFEADVPGRVWAELRGEGLIDERARPAANSSRAGRVRPPGPRSAAGPAFGRWASRDPALPGGNWRDGYGGQALT